MRVAGIALAGWALLLAEPTKEEAAKKDLEALAGTWKVVSFEIDGTKMPAEKIKGWKLTIRANKYALHRGDEVLEGTIQVNPAAKPKAIDATRTSGKHKGTTVHGIYRLNGDELRACYNPRGKDERPKEFSAKAGTGQRIYVFKREKP